MKLPGFRLKHRAYYSWIWPAVLVLSIVAATAVIRLWLDTEVEVKDVTDVFFAVVAGAAAFIFFLYKQHLDETRLFMDLFAAFNAKYDDLNGDLNDILDGPADQALRPSERKKLFDYFNLCAEEYMYFKAGYIDPEVWLAWRKGMQTFLKSARVESLLIEELKGGSYYGLSIEEIKRP